MDRLWAYLLITMVPGLVMVTLIWRAGQRQQYGLLLTGCTLLFVWGLGDSFMGGDVAERADACGGAVLAPAEAAAAHGAAVGGGRLFEFGIWNSELKRADWVVVWLAGPLWIEN